MARAISNKLRAITTKARAISTKLRAITTKARAADTKSAMQKSILINQSFLYFLIFQIQ